MDKKISTSNTKAQIIEAYNELLKKQQEKSEDKPKEVQQRKEAAKTVESAQSNSEAGIIKDIAGLKTSFLDSLEKVQDNLTAEYKKLAEIQEAIKIEKKNLEDLYGLSSNADSFAAILLAQKESHEKFAEETKTAKETFELEMAETKAKWNKDKTARETQIKEENEFQKKIRKREEEEYNYDLQQKRKKETDEYSLKKVQQEADLKEKKIAFEREFAEREKDIIEKEQEYNTLKKASEIFPKELEKAVQQANKELEEKLVTEFNYKEELLAKETEGQIKLKELQIATLENKIKEIENQVKLSNQKAETSEKSVKDIALKAIESSTKVQIVEKERTMKE
ncbi:MAG: hypothetical protein K8R53_04700 [Bacteroidales bacterium]|nr:hypothetical protein [Bacteroidales bacterium]